MNFDFSPEQVQLQNEARRFLQDRCPISAVRAVLEGQASFDRALWRGLAGMGFLGAAVPEAYGGLGLGYLELCVIAEELGRALAPVPVSSSVYLATEFLLAAGEEAQRARWLPKLADGTAIGTFAWTDAEAAPVRFEGGRLSGSKLPVPDGAIADIAIVAAEGALLLVELDQPGVRRTPVDTLDPTRNHARLDFADAAAEPLGPPGAAPAVIGRVLDKAAVLFAFEQVGGATRALEMARDQALERMAFGRQIGSFQAIKHMIADMYVEATLARSNAYYGAWALSADAPELPAAAAAARVCATRAYQLCARNNIQVHGGMGFTWEADCHLHYRRSNLLAVALGGLARWEDLLVERLRADAA